MLAFIATDHESTGLRIREVLSFGGHDCPTKNIVSIDDAYRRLTNETRVDLIIMSLPSDRERGLAILPALARIAPGKVIVVGPTLETRLVLRGLRAGASDFVDLADLEIDLKVALERMESAATAPTDPGRVIALLAPNGGSGSSTLAANIAVSLTKGEKRVALFDMKLESGDLAALLDLKPTYTLADLCHNAARLDRVMFERSLVKHDSGVHLLAPPLELADISHVRPEGIAQALALARAAFPYVVVDVDHTFREEQQVILRQSDVIVIVFRLDFTSLRNVKRTIDYLVKLNISSDKLRIVVNRQGQAQEVPASKAQEALGLKISHFVPEDTKSVNRANNHGVPVVLEAPSAKISKSIQQLALILNGQAGR